MPPRPVGQAGGPGPANRAPDMVTMQYPNSDVMDVLRLYENLTGRKLVMDNNVQGKVNIFIAKPIPREEAIRIIEMNLALNGFSLVPTEGEIVEVIGINKNPRAAAVPIISDPADLPSGAQVVSYLFRLNYADPQELQQVLSQYLAGIGGQAPILALPKSSSLLITQSADVLRKLVKMVEQIDVAPAEVTSKFIRLERADAEKVVEMLKEIFDKGDQPNQPGGVRRVRGIVPPGAQGQGNDDEGGGVLSEDSLIVGKIKLEADVRTNRIHVITRPINLPFIEKLIAEFDANVEFGQPVVRPLRYIAAADVLPVLVNALTEPGDQNQQGQQGLNPNQQRNQARNQPTPVRSIWRYQQLWDREYVGRKRTALDRAHGHHSAVGYGWQYQAHRGRAGQHHHRAWHSASIILHSGNLFSSRVDDTPLSPAPNAIRQNCLKMVLGSCGLVRRFKLTSADNADTGLLSLDRYKLLLRGVF